MQLNVRNRKWLESSNLAWLREERALIPKSQMREAVEGYFP